MQRPHLQMYFKSLEQLKKIFTNNTEAEAEKPYED